MLNQHASQKTKYVRGNKMLFMAKQLSKEIMKKSRFKIKENKRQKKIKFFIIGKESTMCIFCENLREDNIKT